MTEHAPDRSRSSTPQRPDRLPEWWHRLTYRLDLVGRLAEWLEPNFDNRWAPLILLAFPVLLLLLALVIAALR